ncbi:MAG: hypothetical protein HEP71_32415 [Roseivirga sp.]|nr:hypothetical protein [Roseivirga sp.]
MQTQSLSKKINRSYWALMLSMCFLVSCSVAQKTQAVSESTAYLAVAKEKLGDKVKFDFNEDRSYVLCQSEIPATSNSKSFGFIVFDMKNEKVVLEQNVSSGFVQWLSNLEIEVFTTPGFMRNDQSRDDFTQVYHVISGKSTPKTDWTK